jgi:hypothetical protein
MKKIIPTMFAIVMAISSASLLIGCSGGPAEDPDAAAANNAGEAPKNDNSDLSDEEQKKMDAAINPPDTLPEK